MPECGSTGEMTTAVVSGAGVRGLAAYWGALTAGGRGGRVAGTTTAAVGGAAGTAASGLPIGAGSTCGGRNSGGKAATSGSGAAGTAARPGQRAARRRPRAPTLPGMAAQSRQPVARRRRRARALRAVAAGSPVPAAGRRRWAPVVPGWAVRLLGRRQGRDAGRRWCRDGRCGLLGRRQGGDDGLGRSGRWRCRGQQPLAVVAQHRQHEAWADRQAGYVGAGQPRRRRLVVRHAHGPQHGGGAIGRAAAGRPQHRTQHDDHGGDENREHGDVAAAPGHGAADDRSAASSRGRCVVRDLRRPPERSTRPTSAHDSRMVPKLVRPHERARRFRRAIGRECGHRAPAGLGIVFGTALDGEDRVAVLCRPRASGANNRARRCCS